MTPIIQISSPLPRLRVLPVCNRHQGEGDLLGSQGEGEYQSVTGTKRRGEGAVVSHPFLGGGGSNGMGAYQSVTGAKCRGEGAVVSHPFLGEGDPLWTHGEGLRRWAGIDRTLVRRLLSKEGLGDRDESFKGACPKGERGIHQLQPRGGG